MNNEISMHYAKLITFALEEKFQLLNTLRN